MAQRGEPRSDMVTFVWGRLILTLVIITLFRNSKLQKQKYPVNHVSDETLTTGRGEWVSDCCLTPIQQFFQLYHGENKLIFNETMMRSALF